MEKIDEAAVRGRISDLGKEIRQYKGTVKKADDMRFLHTFAVVGAFVTAAFLGWGIGSLTNNLAVAMYLSLAGAGIVSINGFIEIGKASETIKEFSKKIEICEKESAELSEVLTESKTVSKAKTTVKVAKKETPKVAPKYNYQKDSNKDREVVIGTFSEEDFEPEPDEKPKRR